MSVSAPSGVSAPKNNISGYKTRTTANFTPEQMQLFAKLLGGVGGLSAEGGGLDWLSKLAGGDEEAFEQSEAPAYSAYNKMLGELGSRFSQFGAQDSSAFQNATTGAAGQLAETLQSKRLGLQQGAINRLLDLSQNLLGQRPYDQEFEKTGIDWGSIAKLLGKAGITGAGYLLGGPAGGIAGGLAGAKAGKAIFG